VFYGSAAKNANTAFECAVVGEISLNNIKNNNKLKPQYIILFNYDKTN